MACVRTMEIGAIILAAGASRRLGRAKQLISYNGETLLARTIRVARQAGAQPLMVVLGAEYEAISAAVDLSAAQVVRNADWEQGIASSIHAGLRAMEELAQNGEGAMILTCDQPRLTAEHLRLLMGMFRARDGKCMVASAYAADLGVPAVFPREIFAELYALSGDKGARVLFKAAARTVVQVDFPGGELDVDTPQDLAGLD
jgi:molybdenum cofactor cytidylyltransferase